MFTKNIFNQKDGIADLVGNILEADYKNKVEELKGDQHKIDKNKNGKIDSHDFKILRGEKPMQKEAAELEEGSTSKEKQKTPYRDIKSPEYKAAADKQKEKMKQDAATDSGKKLLNKIMSKSKNEEVEKKKENPFDALMKAAKERQGPQPSGGSGMKKGTRYGGSRQKDVKEEVIIDESEQITELKKSTLLRYTTKANKSSVALGVKAARARDDDDMETWAKNRNKADNRDKNIMRAKRKLSEEEVELEEGSKHAARPRSASRPGTEPPVKGKIQDRMAAARERMDAKKKDVKEETEQIDERTLTKGETAEKERIVKGMKNSLAGFKSRYGDKAKSVMYATATKAAKKD